MKTEMWTHDNRPKWLRPSTPAGWGQTLYTGLAKTLSRSPACAMAVAWGTVTCTGSKRCPSTTLGPSHSPRHAPEPFRAAKPPAWLPHTYPRLPNSRRCCQASSRLARPGTCRSCCPMPPAHPLVGPHRWAWQQKACRHQPSTAASSPLGRAPCSPPPRWQRRTHVRKRTPCSELPTCPRRPCR